MKQKINSEFGQRPPAGSRLKIRRTLLALVVACGVTGAAVAVGPLDPSSQVAAAPPPGVRPEVQKWFKLREKSQIELNNSLVLIVQKKIEQPGAAPAACHRVAQATSVLLAMAAAPDPKVDALARAGLTKFNDGAAACLAGDLAKAEQLVAEGLAERTAAQEPLDETLDGE